MFAHAGANVREIRVPADLEGIDAIAIPGGESTVISKLLSSSELDNPLQELLDNGLPAFGTCAGMILLASDVLDGIADQGSFGVIDLTVRRNGIGPQSRSAELTVEVKDLDLPFPAVFIRPPVVERAGEDVEVLAAIDDRPVLCRQGPVMVASFHPEISGDSRIHSLFLQGL